MDFVVVFYGQNQNVEFHFLYHSLHFVGYALHGSWNPFLQMKKYISEEFSIYFICEIFLLTN